MKITLEQINNTISAVKKLGRMDLGSVKDNYRLMKVSDDMMEESNKYLALYLKTMEKYGTPREDGDFNVPADSIENVYRELEEIAKIEVELDWEPIPAKLEMLRGFTAQDMKVLDGVFITIETEEGEGNG